MQHTFLVSHLLCITCSPPPQDICPPSPLKMLSTPTPSSRCGSPFSRCFRPSVSYVCAQWQEFQPHSALKLYSINIILYSGVLIPVLISLLDNSGPSSDRILLLPGVADTDNNCSARIQAAHNNITDKDTEELCFQNRRFVHF